MAINLEKGQRINLSKSEPGLQEIVVGLGWDTKQADTGTDFDLDSSAFMITEAEKIPSEEYFIFYNNLRSPDGSVVHEGDNRTGVGEGDDETLQIDLSRVEPSVQSIVFVTTIHDADSRRQNFGQVRNAFIRIMDKATKREILRYDLEEDYSTEAAIEFGRLYKKGGEWRFQAVGSGYKLGLQAFVDQYT